MLYLVGNKSKGDHAVCLFRNVDTMMKPGVH